MFRLIAAERFEDLENALLSELMQRHADPFHPETVLVGSVGMERALELKIADRYGISAAIHFDFPGQWLWQQVAKLLPQFPAESPFAPEVLEWRILSQLQDSAKWTLYPRLSDYLAGADALGRYDLACLIARTFDAYLTYRPDWFLAWQAGRTIDQLPKEARADEAWQQALWRSLLGDMVHERVLSAEDHPAHLFLNTLSRLQATGQDPLPMMTIHVFCVPSLPPLYLDWLRGLGELITVQCYVLNPTVGYWHDLVSQKTKLKADLKGEGEFLEVGHPLLTSWGGATQAFHQLLLQLGDPVDVPTIKRLPLPAPRTRLEALQQSIRELEPFAPESLKAFPPDDSLQIHCCHGLIRELEVLHDTLLMCFKNDPTLKPEDILVVLPQLEDAIPLIEGVFGGQDAQAIPYAITGAAPKQESPAVEMLLTVLRLAESRCSLSDVFEALRLPVLAQRFQLDEEELADLQAAFHRAGTRWGLDDQHRVALDLPATAAHSLQEGFDRLGLGFALADESAVVLMEMMPMPAMEGQRAEALARLSEFYDLLLETQRALTAPADAGRWGEIVSHLLDRLLPETSAVRIEAAKLKLILAEWSGALSGFRGVLPSEVALKALRTRLETAPRGGVPTGAVTFTAIHGLRAIPFRWIAVLGLNDRVFPRVQEPVEFDLMVKATRLGDRRPDQEDKALFLDLLLSARSGLILSYSGFDNRDATELPPSILISELIELLAMRQELVHVHALQPSSPRYFNAVAPKSFRGSYAALLNQHRPTLEVQKFFDAPLSQPARIKTSFALHEISRFLSCPARTSLETRLGVVVPARVPQEEDSEDLIPGRFAQSALAERLFSLLEAGLDEHDLEAFVRAGHEFPEGVWGDDGRALVLNSVKDWVWRVREARGEASQSAVTTPWSLVIGGQHFSIEGEVRDVFEERRVVAHWSEPWAKRWLELWVAHLFINQDTPRQTLIVSESDTTLLAALSPDVAKTYMTDLIALYEEGLTHPLHFFPKSSWAYVSALSDDERLNKARAVWWPQEFSKGRPECEDPWFQQAFRGIEDPLDTAFEALSVRILEPLLLQKGVQE